MLHPLGRGSGVTPVPEPVAPKFRVRVGKIQNQYRSAFQEAISTSTCDWEGGCAPSS
jgi:hypothetical protein